MWEAFSWRDRKKVNREVCVWTRSSCRASKAGGLCMGHAAPVRVSTWPLYGWARPLLVSRQASLRCLDFGAVGYLLVCQPLSSCVWGICMANRGYVEENNTDGRVTYFVIFESFLQKNHLVNITSNCRSVVYIHWKKFTQMFKTHLTSSRALMVVLVERRAFSRPGAAQYATDHKAPHSKELSGPTVSHSEVEES